MFPFSYLCLLLYYRSCLCDMSMHFVLFDSRKMFEGSLVGGFSHVAQNLGGRMDMCMIHHEFKFYLLKNVICKYNLTGSKRFYPLFSQVQFVLGKAFFLS